MATNWDSILSNTNNLNDVLSILKKVLANLDTKADSTTINEAVSSIEQLKIAVDSSLGEVDSTLDQFQAQANEVIAQGFYESYTTEALLLAAKPAVSEMRARADNTRKIWRWNRTSAEGVAPVTGTWTDTGLSELDQAKDFANANGLFTPIGVLSNSTVLASDFKTKGWYIFPSAAPAIAAGLPEATAGILLVISNDAKTLIHQKWMPFNSNSEFTRSANAVGVFPAFQKIITQSYLDTRLMSELANYVSVENVSQYTTKPYDIITMSKNLFDDSKKQVGKLIDSASGRITSAAGWSCSDFIPVIEGAFYTTSYSAKRTGIAFYSTKESATTASIGYNGSTNNPLTVQVPTGANFMVVNIDSPTIAANSVQVEAGQVATPYETAGTKYQIDASYLNTSAENLSTKLAINGDNATVSGIVDGVPISLDLLLTKENTHSQSTVLNFTGDYVDNVLQRALNDDVAPMRLDGYTIGANHGYEKSNLTLASHGKTTDDIGSVWSSGGKEYVIVDIVSTSVLSVTSRIDNVAFTIGTLTHVSGATNTTSFTPTSTASAMWFPSIRDRKLNCFVDDVKIDLTKNSIYNFNNTVKFLESYSIMKKSDMVEWLIANKGQNYVNYAAVPCYTVNFGYTFDHELGCAIYFGGVGRKQVALADQMITQSIQLAQGNGTVYNYIPKATEFTAGGFTYNFSQLENLYSKNPSAPLFLTAARQEAGTSPIDRIIMLNDQVGYATGYLPILDAAPDVRSTNASNKYLEIRNGTLKLYPRLIDSATINQINDGDAFAAIAYRKYFKRSTDRTCKYVVRSEMGDFLYLDWHTAKTDEIELPADLIGREFEIVERSNNVNLLSKFASNSILVKIDSTKNYGYLVLKFK